MEKIAKAKNFFGISWPYLAIITANLIWGVNFLVAKVTLVEIPSMSLAFLRFFFAFILLLPFLISDRKNLKVKKDDFPWFILVGSLVVTINITAFYEGISRTSVIDASVLSLTVPVISVLLGWIFLKEKVFTINLFGVLSGLIGAILIIGLPLGLIGKDVPLDKTLGDLLIIVSSFCWVVGAVLMRKFLKDYSSITVTSSLFLIGAISFLIPAVQDYLKDPTWPGRVTYLGYLGLSYITFFSSVIAFFLFDWGLKALGVIKTDLFQYIQPLTATTLAVLFLSDQLHYSLIIGGALIALGTYWGTLGKEHHRHPHSHKH